MIRSASHFCFVVFPPQGLLDVLESQMMKRTSISYWEMRDFAISAMVNSTKIRIRERTVRAETLDQNNARDSERVVRIFWEAKLHSAKFWACELEFNYTKRLLVSRFSIYIALLDILESQMMKRTSISYWATRDFAVRNRPLDRNDGRNVKRSAYVPGSGRDFCDGELNYTKRLASRVVFALLIMDSLK